uniref:5'-nucleotidase, C-terminal domain n=1 Tax=Candidatus Kentrum sp. LFY TaxID=2126342 RepID=A0A450UU68_9GAMM|nr:MAG: hypothetical protein BECKLFY1418A_GA0070994_105522 [Candidatus Kentron sp. LFY]
MATSSPARTFARATRIPENGSGDWPTYTTKSRRSAKNIRTPSSSIPAIPSRVPPKPSIPEGQALVDILNRFHIDAFVPGNWDFLYGTERFRELFAGDSPKANWNALAANLYYATLYDFPLSRYPDKAGQRVLPFYLVREVDNIKVGIIGLTADRGPQAVSPRTMDGFFLTPGKEELKAAIPLLRDKPKVDLLVLLSERGLAANLELVEIIPGVDIVLSSDMHEETWQVLEARTGTLLVEEGQDGTMLGELHLTHKGSRHR